MTLEQILHAIGIWIHDIAVALAPAAFGSAVAQAYEAGLTWSQRMTQWVVGITVSYYLGRWISAWRELDPFAANAVVFVLALMAYKATPKFTARAIELVEELPGIARDWILRRKGPPA